MAYEKGLLVRGPKFAFIYPPGVYLCINVTFFPRYQQAHEPVIQQETVEGHSVRVMYLLTAIADLALLDADFRKAYEPVLIHQWNNMVAKKMYVTGGIGAMDQWEGFGIDYFLPQATDEGGSYSETCAGIGVMMLANRMVQVSLISTTTTFLLPNYYPFPSLSPVLSSPLYSNASIIPTPVYKRPKYHHQTNPVSFPSLTSSLISTVATLISSNSPFTTPF